MTARDNHYVAVMLAADEARKAQQQATIAAATAQQLAATLPNAVGTSTGAAGMYGLAGAASERITESIGLLGVLSDSLITYGNTL